jgi:hypothetical protein
MKRVRFSFPVWENWLLGRRDNFHAKILTRVDESFRYARSNIQSTLMQLLFSFDRGTRIVKTSHANSQLSSSTSTLVLVWPGHENCENSWLQSFACLLSSSFHPALDWAFDTRLSILMLTYSRERLSGRETYSYENKIPALRNALNRAIHNIIILVIVVLLLDWRCLELRRNVTFNKTFLLLSTFRWNLWIDYTSQGSK